MLKFKVVQVESGAQYRDKQRRVYLRLDNDDMATFATIRVTDKELGTVGLQLDDVVEMEVRPTLEGRSGKR